MDVSDRAPSWMLTGGIRAWLLLGMLGLAAVLFLLVDALGAFLLPLLCALLLGMLFAPMVDWLHARRVPMALAAGLVLAGLTMAVLVSIKLTVEGVVDQAPTISAQVAEGADALRDGLEQAGLSTGALDEVTGDSDAFTKRIADGAVGNAGAIFSGIGSLFFGLFTFVFLLFYALTDWKRISDWAGRSLGVPEAIGAELFTGATNSVRQYFAGVTISSLVVATIIGLTMHLLGLPLAFTIALVTFVTSYIPYLGAILSGAFACIVALGSGGVEQALVVLAVVLVTQNVLQAIMQTRITSQTMNVHPILNFGAAIVGAIAAGAIGAIIAPPLVATLLYAHRVLSAHAAASVGDVARA